MTTIIRVRRIRQKSLLYSVSIGLASLMLLGLDVAMVSTRESTPSGWELPITYAAPAFVLDEVVQHREPPPPPPPQPPAPAPIAKAQPRPKPRPKAAAPVIKASRAVNVDVYRGLGAWVDIYDTGLDPTAAVEEMKRRGVRTLYLETNNYRSGASNACQYGPDVDIRYPEVVTQYLDQAHKRGMNVVAWYLPGFANIERDIKRSLAAINFSTPSGNRFDGFAPDIETRGEFGCAGVPGEQVREKFNAAIVEYTQRLRAAVGADKVLGAIVVDAKNNEKAPGRWEGFPWPEIGKSYDAILPMAYWTASPDNGGCPGADVDVRSYMHQVVDKTNALMKTSKPFHLIGGVANCITQAETAGYVNGAKDKATLGVSLYDFSTTENNPAREGLWAELSKFG